MEPRKMPIWNLKFGSKGFAFTIDAIIAVILVIAFINAISFYDSKQEASLEYLQMARVADDVVNMLHRNGLLREYNQDADKDKNKPGSLEYELNSILSSTPYAMRIKIKSLENKEGHHEEKDTKTSTPLPTDNRIIVSGKVVFVVPPNNKKDIQKIRFAVAQYYIWEK